MRAARGFFAAAGVAAPGSSVNLKMPASRRAARSDFFGVGVEDDRQHGFGELGLDAGCVAGDGPDGVGDGVGGGGLAGGGERIYGGLLGIRGGGIGWGGGYGGGGGLEDGRGELDVGLLLDVVFERGGHGERHCFGQGYRRRHRLGDALDGRAGRRDGGDRDSSGAASFSDGMCSDSGYVDGRTGGFGAATALVLLEGREGRADGLGVGFGGRDPTHAGMRPRHGWGTRSCGG